MVPIEQYAQIIKWPSEIFYEMYDVCTNVQFVQWKITFKDHPNKPVKLFGMGSPSAIYVVFLYHCMDAVENIFCVMVLWSSGLNMKYIEALGFGKTRFEDFFLLFDQRVYKQHFFYLMLMIQKLNR